MTDLFRLDGRVAIVTGASGGLGVTFARVLAEAGADLSICARRQAPLEETGEMVRALGRRCLTLQTDVSQNDQVQEFVARTLDEYGKIDILVNNAGIGSTGVADEKTLEEFVEEIDVNLVSVFNLSQRVGKEMLARGYGRIVNIASVSGINAAMPADASIGYTPSKSGVIGLTKEFAVQWAKTGITVNAIAPAYFPSDLGGGVHENPDVLEEIEQRTPMGRMGQPEELAGALLLFASDASTYVTGQVLSVDGGWTAW
jgi:gluconate 5-dehydrogenase